MVSGERTCMYSRGGLTQPMDPEKKSLNFIFPTKYVIPKSLKFSHWPSKWFLGSSKWPLFDCQDS